MLSVFFAVLTAAANSCASVLQRSAAAHAPPSDALRPALITDLLRYRVWLAGIGLVVLAAICQAVALATGSIAVVQPIFVIELPAALLVAGLFFHRRLPRRVWCGVVTVFVGLALGLSCAAPSGGSQSVYSWFWLPTLVVVVVAEAALVTMATHVRGNARAALLALATACAYALTAALMKDAMARLTTGAGAFFSAWQLYATAIAGVGALFLLQNALQAGSLAASQPVLTLGDALISTTFGVMLFSEHIRTGLWLVPELAAIALIAVGCLELARSPLAAATLAPPRR